MQNDNDSPCGEHEKAFRKELERLKSVVSAPRGDEIQRRVALLPELERNFLQLPIDVWRDVITELVDTGDGDQPYMPEFRKALARVYQRRSVVKIAGAGAAGMTIVEQIDGVRRMSPAWAAKCLTISDKWAPEVRAALEEVAARVDVAPPAPAIKADPKPLVSAEEESRRRDQILKQVRP